MSVESYVRFAKSQSKCVRRQVGSALVLDGVVYATGYNYIKGEDAKSRAYRAPCNQGGCPRGRKSYEDKEAFADYSDCYATHAEVAACESFRRLYGGKPDGRFTLYTSCEPCADCAAYLRERSIDWEILDV